jgi:hypothetical protein
MTVRTPGVVGVELARDWRSLPRQLPRYSGVEGS